MARPRSFDENEVLDRVTRTFWERGYTNTSIADLEAASGLGRQSLYSAFGDKHALFLKALARYGTQASNSGIFGGITESAMEQLKATMNTAVDFFTAAECPGPCLVVQALLEFGGSNPDVSAQCQRNTGRVEAWVRERFVWAQAAGELAPGVDPDQATTVLMGQYFAIPVMARNGAPAQQLKDGIALLLQQFSAKRSPASS